MPLLNLTDADTTGFEALPPSRYPAEVFEATMQEVKKDTGKMPIGTPMINVQMRITGPTDAEENRRAFRSFVIPPDDYGVKPKDEKKKKAADKMNGMIVRFLLAIGYTEEDLRKPDFDLDLEAIQGKECAVQLTRVPKMAEDPQNPTKYVATGEMKNEIAGFYPIGELTAVGASGGLL